MWLVYIHIIIYCAAVSSISGEYVRDWNTRKVEQVEKLSLLPGQEFTYRNFDPPLHLREDGAPFMAVAVVDSASWVALALNSFVSIAKYHSINGITVMTEDDGQLEKIFKRLGIYAYNANSTIKTFPPDFGVDKRLPNWSWGEIIFMRFNLWFEAFRRKVGFCSLDLDVTYSQNVLFPKVNGKYVDIAMQGHVINKDPAQKNSHCKCSTYVDMC